MRYQARLCRKILLANQFAGFSTFDLIDLLILIPGVYCYIVLVFYVRVRTSLEKRWYRHGVYFDLLPCNKFYIFHVF